MPFFRTCEDDKILPQDDEEADPTRDGLLDKTFRTLP
eukprot:CAMPEP_0116849190 /NCGR_PEP_ID=MMETSP0418-20121206/15429_1 /TAXON_ID=1158023 /ORGANISM="Astrosyne radiata, Strain 13vi08-1A" /LENGTH=36 /DNA_ID= /DNA_START= /DNA_END= /DNA_ORIENTATION=